MVNVKEQELLEAVGGPFDFESYNPRSITEIANEATHVSLRQLIKHQHHR
jgi:hypothetical protein